MTASSAAFSRARQEHMSEPKVSPSRQAVWTETSGRAAVAGSPWTSATTGGWPPPGAYPTARKAPWRVGVWLELERRRDPRVGAPEVQQRGGGRVGQLDLPHPADDDLVVAAGVHVLELAVEDG